jgi:hypothetical protein
MIVTLSSNTTVSQILAAHGCQPSQSLIHRSCMHMAFTKSVVYSLHMATTNSTQKSAKYMMRTIEIWLESLLG